MLLLVCACVDVARSTAPFTVRECESTHAHSFAEIGWSASRILIFIILYLAFSVGRGGVHSAPIESDVLLASYTYEY